MPKLIPEKLARAGYQVFENWGFAFFSYSAFGPTCGDELRKTDACYVESGAGSGMHAPRIPRG